MTDPVAHRLLRILEVERAALLSGDFDRLRGFDAEKSELIDSLESARPDAETLALLSNLVQRNLALADAARRGIRDVAERLKAVGRVQKSFETYSRDGSRISVSNGQHDLEKRA